MQSTMGVKVAVRAEGQLESTGMLEEAPWGDVPVISQDTASKYHMPRRRQQLM